MLFVTFVFGFVCLFSCFLSMVVDNQRIPLSNGFNFTIQCLTDDHDFCNKIDIDMIKTGERISKELYIYETINVKVLVYSFGKDNTCII